jgi:hypothetical protein
MTTYSLNWSTGFKPPIIVNEGELNTVGCSLTLVGRNVTNWADKLQADKLHLLEHFCSSIAPSFPTVGQLWYEPSTSSIYLYSIDGYWKRMWSETATILGGFTAIPHTSSIAPFNFTVGQNSFSSLVTASEPIVEYSVAVGSIPPGMSLVISGTNLNLVGVPTIVGTYEGVLTITHSLASTIPAQLAIAFSVVIGVVAIAFTVSPLVTASGPAILSSGVGYTLTSPQSFMATANTVLSSVNLTDGALPPGMSLQIVGSSIRLVGTPITPGLYTPIIQVAQVQPSYTPITRSFTAYIQVN